MRAPVLKRPVEVKYRISQEFGFDNTNHSRRHDFYNHFGKKYPGVDFDTPLGVEVKAAFSGQVMRREFHQGMGKVIGIRNGNIVALYAHLSDFNVKLGQWVETEKPISRWKSVLECFKNPRFIARLLKWQLKIWGSYTTESR
jgi:murein DD-endopeptidase MepM/ murein hydrolase activator NlpD